MICEIREGGREVVLHHPTLLDVLMMLTLLFRGIKMSEWISVKDRLPDADGIYLVCDRRLNGVPWVHTAGFKKTSSSWCESHGMYYDDRYGRYREQDKFTHWLPLPEPPKEEKR